MPATDYLSATALAKKTAAALDSLEQGDKDKLIILKNNAPKAVLLSFEAYEALEEELEDLRLGALALARLQTFAPENALSHEEMLKKSINELESHLSSCCGGRPIPSRASCCPAYSAGHRQKAGHRSCAVRCAAFR
ncbi:prevent-host-death family protein [Candidatus Electrothrix aarhusensis]|uniref:Antitoxin n=1 Tax=Candidatus Electrothrix aarhusensis TaxID=1859131 RepID=A0A444J176_9BACT|nr:prevent-host-death family protein [Candidatus Electrothrix aarhusensis]